MEFPYLFILHDGTKVRINKIKTKDRTCFIFTMNFLNGNTEQFLYYYPVTESEETDEGKRHFTRQRAIHHLKEYLLS